MASGRYDERAREIAIAWFDKADGTRTLGDSQKHLAFIIAAAMEEAAAPFKSSERLATAALAQDNAALSARIEAAAAYCDHASKMLAAGHTREPQAKWTRALLRILRGEEPTK